MSRLIDADELVKKFKQWMGIEYRMQMFIADVIKTIKEQPTVELPETAKWIPCSERLPEMHREDMEAEGEYYMISNPVIVTDGQQIYIAEYEEDIDNMVVWHSLDGEDYENIIAWMPLPEPYNQERRNT